MRVFFALVLVVISAFSVVYSKHYARQQFQEITRLEARLREYDVEWGQLQLEQTTFAGHARVERSARRQLGLVLADRESTVYLKP